MKLVRVVVVDDSAYNRRSISKMLQEMPGVEVVGYAANGEEGLRRIVDLRPDLVTLDLEMPRMDGFTLLRIIMNSCPTPVIVVSSQTGDEKVFKALELGAVDFVPKPTNKISTELLKIRENLQEKVRNVLHLKLRGRASAALPSLPEGRFIPSPVLTGKTDIVAIGASTGGPPALYGMFSVLTRSLPISVLVSQHMPPGFTRAFAERLNRASAFEIREAAHGDPVLPGQVLIAPGGCNMLFEQVDGRAVVRLQEPSPADRYIPSVDAMFASLAEIYRERLLAVVMTGMGNDGSRGIRAVKAAGGKVVAEAEETTVVFGMPREAIATGVVDRIVPLDRMVREIVNTCGFMPAKA
ncbi:protein-glutamate methylesterase/protein-glutamine glutaminase [Geobacter argillaceus]|uniref:Protein-glutamate methylesterase/protein-glutamine glutaminase n=1 Tax=Geobacter argillaceus TaxID=345631 RepID=A0A562W815_9BACT|nr:chemotaxis response regulator protein-glutamate methylesterase [Geobacter argillaceus]TWJ26390.1 two-component system chemotaxis response regulator CheB [Geobacter argillaceus]